MTSESQRNPQRPAAARSGTKAGVAPADVVVSLPQAQSSGPSDAARTAAINESLPAVDASVPLARRLVVQLAAAAGLKGPLLDAVAVAVSEAVTNAVRHAYRGLPGRVQLTAYVCGSELWVLVADDGCGHHVPAHDPGLGLGLALIAESCDDFVLAERGAGGTEAQMRFRIGDRA